MTSLSTNTASSTDGTGETGSRAAGFYGWRNRRFGNFADSPQTADSARTADADARRFADRLAGCGYEVRTLTAPDGGGVEVWFRFLRW